MEFQRNNMGLNLKVNLKTVVIIVNDPGCG